MSRFHGWWLSQQFRWTVGTSLNLNCLLVSIQGPWGHTPLNHPTMCEKLVVLQLYLMFCLYRVLMHHRAYQPLLPCANKYLQLKWDKASHGLHRRKVRINMYLFFSSGIMTLSYLFVNIISHSKCLDFKLLYQQSFEIDLLHPVRQKLALSLFTSSDKTVCAFFFSQGEVC